MAQNHNEGNNHQEHHMIELDVYLKVFAALIVLTGLTVLFFFIRHQIGWLAVPLAFIIATTKAALVMMYFMHMKYENTLNRLIFGLGFFFLMVLIFFSGIDIYTRVFQGSTL